MLFRSNTRVNIGGGILTTLASPIPVNRNYWRDAAKYYSMRSRMIQIRLSLINRSSFSLSDAKLEVTCTAPDGEQTIMMRADHLPEEPKSEFWGNIPVTSTVFDRASDRVKVDNRGPEPECHIRLQTLLPGEEGRSHDDLAILPSGPGKYTLQIRILAGEINPPIVEEHKLEVSGPVYEMDFEKLQVLMFPEHLKDNED